MSGHGWHSAPPVHPGVPPTVTSASALNRESSTVAAWHPQHVNSAAPMVVHQSEASQSQTGSGWPSDQERRPNLNWRHLRLAPSQDDAPNPPPIPHYEDSSDESIDVDQSHRRNPSVPSVAQSEDPGIPRHSVSSMSSLASPAYTSFFDEFAPNNEVKPPADDEDASSIVSAEGATLLTVWRVPVPLGVHTYLESSRPDSGVLGSHHSPADLAPAEVATSTISVSAGTSSTLTTASTPAPSSAVNPATTTSTIDADTGHSVSLMRMDDVSEADLMTPSPHPMNPRGLEGNLQHDNRSPSSTAAPSALAPSATLLTNSNPPRPQTGAPHPGAYHHLPDPIWGRPLYPETFHGSLSRITMRTRDGDRAPDRTNEVQAGGSSGGPNSDASSRRVRVRTESVTARREFNASHLPLDCLNLPADETDTPPPVPSLVSASIHSPGEDHEPVHGQVVSPNSVGSADVPSPTTPIRPDPAIGVSGGGSSGSEHAHLVESSHLSPAERECEEVINRFLSGRPGGLSPGSAMVEIMRILYEEHRGNIQESTAAEMLERYMAILQAHAGDRRSTASVRPINDALPSHSSPPSSNSVPADQAGLRLRLPPLQTFRLNGTSRMALVVGRSNSERDGYFVVHAYDLATESAEA